MNISELIEALEDIRETYGELEVYSSSNYGDYHNTEQIDNIESVSLVVPENSAYSGTGLCVPDDYENESNIDDQIEAGHQVLVVLRYKE